MHDHVGVQMAAGAGVDLAHWNPRSGNALGIIVSLLVPFNDGKAEFLRQVTQGPFEQRRLAGAGGADQVQDKNPLLFEQGAVEAGQAVVLGKNILFNADRRPFGGFSLMLMGMLVLVGMTIRMGMVVVMVVTVFMIMGVIMILIMMIAAMVMWMVVFMVMIMVVIVIMSMVGW
jgi:hypothetical protein